MKILHLLTGTESTAVAITDDDRVCISINIEGGIRHSETIFNMMIDAFDYVDFSIDEIDKVSVLNGPGSFTGLRVGFAAAKAISFALNIPIITVSTLDAIKSQYNLEDKKVLAMMDARRNRVYVKGYNLNSFLEEQVLNLDDLEHADDEIIIVGENLTKYQEKFNLLGYKTLFDNDIFLNVDGLIKASLKANSADGDVKLNYLKPDEEVVCRKKEI